MDNENPNSSIASVLDNQTLAQNVAYIARNLRKEFPNTCFAHNNADNEIDTGDSYNLAYWHEQSLDHVDLVTYGFSISNCWLTPL